MKSQQNAILLSYMTILFPSFQNIDKSVSTQQCKANLVSQKREKNKSNFRMVNLWTKDFVELWEIKYLNIWT